MPREQINYGTVLVKPDDDLSWWPTDENGTAVPVADLAHGIIGDSNLHVTWTRGAHVQVALEVSVAYAQLAAETPNGETCSDMTMLYTPVLKRDEINKLIRTLRRARDAAYGPDE